MNSILNSISSGDLQVQQAPKEKPVKEDSIIELLENSEIEFESCIKIENNIDDFNTGFGENNDLHYDTPCKKPELKTPLYQENYLREFLTEEEKAAARHALGLYNKGDIVAMSLLTAEDNIPSNQEFKEATIKQLRKGDKFFVPYTLTRSVFDSDGNTLDVRLSNLQNTIVVQQKQISSLLQPSNKQEITTLGDVNIFLNGFNNGDSLKKIIDTIDKEMLRFNTTGNIT